MNTTLVAGMAVFMMALGAGFIFFVLRENERPLPKDGLQWAATTLSTLLVVSAGFLLALTVVPRSADEYGTELLPDEMDAPAPNFAFRTVDDKTKLELEDYRGQVVLLNFWATWCAPCIRELPDLNRLQNTYGPEGLVVLTLSDERRSELLAFEERLPLETVAGYVGDPDDLPQPFRRMLVIRPTTYILDRDGVLREFIKGAGTYAFFEQVLTPYLAERGKRVVEDRG